MLWLYQGLDKVRALVLIEIPMRLAGIVGVLLAVRRPDDAWKVLPLHAVFCLARRSGCAYPLSHLDCLAATDSARVKRQLAAAKSVYAYRLAASVSAAGNPFL